SPACPAVWFRLPSCLGYRLQHLPDDPRARRVPQTRHSTGCTARSDGNRWCDHLGWSGACCYVCGTVGDPDSLPGAAGIYRGLWRIARYLYSPLALSASFDLRYRPNRMVAFQAQSEIRQTCFVISTSLTVRAPCNVSFSRWTSAECIGSYPMTATHRPGALSTVHPVHRWVAATAPSVRVCTSPFSCISDPNAKRSVRIWTDIDG